MINTTHSLEGPRIDANMNVKLDTSLEGTLPEYESNHSSYSASSELPSERGCKHSKIVSYENYETCFNCGAFAPKNGVKNYKSKKMNYMPFFPCKTIYETMTRKTVHLKRSMNPEYAQVRQTYVDWIIELAEKLRISANTTHLGIYLMDIIMFQNPSLMSKIQLYGPVCLLIAAKTIELDERIPFIPKLRRYANPTFTIEEYRRAELHILDMVDWNAQFTPAIEVVEFLLCQGVLYSSDEIDERTSPQKHTKPSPEGLRENTQHENINHLDDRGYPANGLERLLSPVSKENNENSYSDISTTGTNTDNLGTPYTNQATFSQIPAAEEDISPSKRGIATLTKNTSTPANVERNSYTQKAFTSIDKKVDEILASFETHYTKLATLLIKDIDFIEWEPKIVSAAIIVFLRSINRIASVWCSELETITQLRLPQVSACFELVFKKYNTVFAPNLPRFSNVLFTPDSGRNVSGEPKVKAITDLNEKTSSTTSSNRASNLGQDQERKPAFNHQKASNAPAAITTSNTSAYPYMRDELRSRSKPQSATTSTEVSQKNIATKMIPQSGKGVQGYESGSYYSGISTGSTSGITNENYLKADAYSSKTSASAGLSSRGTTPLDSSAAYQSKAGVVKK